MKTTRLLYSIFLVLLSWGSFAQNQSFTKKNHATLGYLWEYLPPGYDPDNKKYPVIIALHGCGEKAFYTNSCASTGSNGATNLGELDKLLRNGVPYEINKRINRGETMCFQNPEGETECFIVVAPQVNNGFFAGQTDWTVSKLDGFINGVIAQYPVDKYKIYLTGLSMGAYGTWKYAQRHPDKFAAIIPISGAGDPAVPACNLANLPIWAFHDDPDPTVGAKGTTGTISMESAINACNGDIRVTLYQNKQADGVTAKPEHKAWETAYSVNPSPASTTTMKVKETYDGALANFGDGYQVYSWLLSRKRTGLAPIVDVSSKSVTVSSTTIPSSVTRQDATSTISAYQWEFLPTSTNPAPVMENANTATLTVKNLTSGTYRFRLTVTDNRGFIDTDEMSLSVNIQNTKVLPGTIQAENHDGISGASAQTTTDTGGGQNIGSITAGATLTYNVNVQTAGNYTIYYRIASNANSTGQFRLKSGSTVLHTVTVPGTGGWQNWKTIGTRANLTTGNQTLTIEAITSGWNINWFSGELAKSISSRIEAESFMNASGVSVENCSDTDGGQNVGGITAGAYLDFNVNVATAGTHTISYRVASNANGTGSFRLKNSAGTVLSTTTVPGTGGWQNWQTITAAAILSSGEQTLRIEAITGGWNLNWFTGSFSSARLIGEKQVEANSRALLYPNPASTELHLKLNPENHLNSRIRIANSHGSNVNKEIRLYKIDESDYRVDIGNLPSGAYLVEIFDDNKVISRQRIMVIK